MDIGISIEGKPCVPLKQTDQGPLIPDVSLSTLQQRQQDCFLDWIEIGVRADNLGYDYFVQPEHHFELLGGNSPNPIQTQTAIAAKTSQIRLLQIANIASWHNPIRLAEQAAALDLISNGRAEVGIGTSSSWRTADIFGQFFDDSSNPIRNHMLIEEVFRFVETAWTDQAVSFDGHFFSVPAPYTEFNEDHEYLYLIDNVSECDPAAFINTQYWQPLLNAVSVFPQPVQSPYPQLWRPTGSKTSAEWAATRGINGCCFCTQFEQTAELIESYHQSAKAANWPDRRVKYSGDPFHRGWDAERKRGIATQLLVFNTEIASERVFEGWRRGIEFMLKKPSSDDTGTDDVDAFIQNNDVPIVGDTVHIADQLSEFAEICGYEDLILFPKFDNVGISTEDVNNQIESFKKDVVPLIENSRN